mgnify:CR=1 FL=1
MWILTNISNDILLIYNEKSRISHPVFFNMPYLSDKKNGQQAGRETKDKDNPGMKNKNLVESVHWVSLSCVLKSSASDEKN